MQVFRAGAFHGQWGIIDNHNVPAPAMSAMRLARHINGCRCEGPPRDARGLARAISSKKWRAKVVNYHRPNQDPVVIKAVKVQGGYVLKLA